MPDTRTTLLDTAEKCFERHGLRRTTMEDIAAAARVSRPTLYRHFGDRDSLIAAVSQRRAAEFAHRIQATFAKHATLEEQIVEGLLYLGKVGQRDQFFSSLITPDAVGRVNQVLLAPAAAVDFAAEVWGPVLDDAQARGELREDMDRQQAYVWLTSVNILLIGWLENAPRATEKHRRLLRDFVAPAFSRG